MTDNDSPKTKHLTTFSHSAADSNDQEASLVGPSVSQAYLYCPPSPSSSTAPAPPPAPAPPYHSTQPHGWLSYRNTRPPESSIQCVHLGKANDSDHGHNNDQNDSDENEDENKHKDKGNDKGKEKDKDKGDEDQLNHLLGFQNQLNHQNDTLKLHHDQINHQNFYNHHYQNDNQHASKETEKLSNIKEMNHHHQQQQQQEEEEEEEVNSAVVTNQSSLAVVNNGFLFIDDELNRDFPQVGNHFNKEDLQDLLNDPNFLKATFLGLNQVKEMMDNHQYLIAANEALVERNLSLRGRLEQVREDSAKAFNHTNTLMSTFRQLSKEQAEVYQPFGEQATRARLLTALHESDRLTENLANEFVNEGSMEEDLFVKHYLEERKIFHRRSLIVERWSEGKILWE